jgi:HAD superfamily hydrolase (TIGR01509 family)
VDGVLVDRDAAYIMFLNTRPGFENWTKDQWIKWRYENNRFSMPSERMGGVRLVDTEFMYQRPVLPRVIETLGELKSRGIRLFTMSLTGQPDEKREWLKSLFGDLLEYEFVMQDDDKGAALAALIKKHGLDPSETMFVDDVEKYLRQGRSAGIKYLVHSRPFDILPESDEFPSVRNISEILDMI